MKTFNLLGDEWDESRDRDGWRMHEAFVGEHIGSELLGACLCEVEPGSKLWPFHMHHGNEEWVIVVRGAPTLRTLEGERALSEGDVVCFPRGKAGAHQIINRTEAPIRVLMLSSAIQPDVIEYLDTNRVLANDGTGRPLIFTRLAPPPDYWEGEG